MVFAANNNPNDTRNQTVTNLPFYPDIEVDKFIKAVRVQDTIADHRLLEAIKNAMIKVNDQLRFWLVTQETAGYVTLADVPSDDYGDITKYEQCYFTAIYSTANSLLINHYRETSSSESGEDRADKMELSADDYLAEAKIAIRKILDIPRATIELI